MELMERRRILLNTPHINIVTGLQFVTDMVAPLESLVIDFSPIQDLHGYDSPWPAGGGKNLLNPNTFFENYFINATGVPTSDNTSHYSAIIPVADGNTYVFSGIGAPSGMGNKRVHGYDSNGNWVKQLGVASNIGASVPYSVTVTIPNGITGVRVSTLKLDTNVQFELGSTATSYAPYSNICPITGWTGLDVTRTGKNLANMFNDGKIPSISNGQLITANGLRSDYIPMAGDTQITFSSNTSSTIYCFFYDSGKNFISRAANASPVSVTTPSNTAYIMLRASASATSLQLEFGSTATAYEPYHSTTYPISWQTEAGTVYGGTLDVTTGVLTVTKVLYEPDAVLTASYHQATGLYYWIVANANNIPYPASSDNVAEIISSHFKEVSGVIRGGCYVTGVGKILVAVPVDQSLNTKELATAWVQENHPTFCYKIAQPFEYQLTPQQVLTLKGTNNLLSNSNGGMTVNYWTHLD